MRDLDGFPVTGDEFASWIMMTGNPDLTFDGCAGILPVTGDGDSCRGGVGFNPDKIGAGSGGSGMDTGEQQENNGGAEKAGD